MIDYSRRYRALNNISPAVGPIVCWLSRDQRAQDNWALLSAQALAQKNKQPLIVIFCLVPSFLGATARAYDFMLSGLQSLEKDLRALNIPFHVLSGEVDLMVPKFCKDVKAGALFSDFSPLLIAKKWKREVNNKIKCAFYEVDAHNIVPTWLASPKQEFGAYTIRPKIKKLLPEFLQEFPKLKKQAIFPVLKHSKNNWLKLRQSLDINESVLPVSNYISGEKAAQKSMQDFIKQRLTGYNLNRNNPVTDGQSGLSPYLHFGQLSAQRLALAVQTAKAPKADIEAFLEELIIRRELADNFCFYNDNYLLAKGFPAWAKKSILKHAGDKRDYLYSLKKLEAAETHDLLWNAAQREMKLSGKMHGYLRMYWAKKILEWTPDAKTALKYAIFLNDKYSLDGRDPNGYAGIAWSIGGTHDRAWFERPIFGQIRYMNDNGCKRKFDVPAYISRWS